MLKRFISTVAAMVLAFTAFAQTQMNTFCNPLDLLPGHERASRGGEPVVLIYEDDYYLFVTGRRGYWYGPDFKNWTYVEAPNFPGGVVSVIEKDGILYACSMNNSNVYKSENPKSGEWVPAGTFDSDRYGDANMFLDDDGRLYMFYGWSQLMPFKVVELDPVTFKEISEPQILFWGDYKNHGFENRRDDDVIFSIFNGRRPYYEEEFPWIEGPWVTKHNGKYYLQYAAIGLELLTYSHGVYVADNPMGPYTYSKHNPLTYKTTGYAVGGGHGSTFHDKNGQLWTICMIPAHYGDNGGAELAIFPTAVDEEGNMYSNVAYGDYPQHWPGTRTDAVDNNFTGWYLLSNKKRVEVSSTFEDNAAKNAVDENFMTNWCAETGNAGEYITVDLGKPADIYAIQCNFNHLGSTVRVGRGAGFAAAPETYQCYIVEVSSDNATWTKIIDKTNNTYDFRHDYTELDKPVNARYVKVTNVSVHDGAKFSMQDLRVFGKTDMTKTVKVNDFKAVRNPQDRREADLLWTPVDGADGYIVRYGVDPKKLYNSYTVYEGNKLNIHSLNSEYEYYYSVEAFDTGLDYYKEKSEVVNGTGAEIELQKVVPGQRMSGWGGDVPRLMIHEGQNEYVFDNLTPGRYTLRHSYGPVLWSGELTEAELIGNGEVTVKADLTELGVGKTQTGMLRMKVITGEKAGKIVVTTEYNRRGAQYASPIVNPDNTVTFNLSAPNAKSVKISAQFAPKTDMYKRADGTWTITLGPVEPDIYPYCFEVDGIAVMDPQNPDWFPNEGFKNSMVDVRAGKDHDVKSVPHGKVDYVNYWSQTMGLHGNAIVYTPPTYDKNTDKKYPVFYLISGTTDTEEVYFKVGKMNLILDNLIAEGKAKEMIIVLPYGNPSKYFPAGTNTFAMGDMFSKDLLNDLMPYVEANYRTINDRENRAIGGFSRGGNQGLAFGLTNIDKFSYLCSYSSFTSMTLPDVYDNAKKTNKMINLFWLGVGTDDFLYGNAKEYAEFLDSKGIKNVQEYTTGMFGHTWMNARYFLSQTFPLLFNKEASAAAMSKSVAGKVKTKKTKAEPAKPAAPARPAAPAAGNGQRLTPEVMAALFPAGVVSPDYNKDGSVTFRVQAANAQKVELECQMFDGTRPMEKGERGVWSLTVKPDQPDIYPYAFVIDGTKIADPNNMFIFPNEGFKYSLADVRGPEPDYQDLQKVPHGKVSYTWYKSNAVGFDRPVCIYTPPGYDPADAKKYPVLYLIHGMTDTYETWFKVGKVNNILDNLIAEGKAEPMIVVMPYANPYPEMMLRGITNRYDSMDTKLTTKEFTESVVPFIEANYNVYTDAAHRAIAGFSLGGRQTLACGLGNPDMFNYVCAFAPAIFGPEISSNFENGTYAPAAELNEKLDLLWLSCGTSDFLYQSSLQLEKNLKDRGINHKTMYPGGGHTWMNCRDYITAVAQLLFK